MNPLDRTIFQTGQPWDPRFDLHADAAMVYGIDAGLPERVRSWRDRGYRVHLMTGLAWGQYQDYLLGRWDGAAHWDDAQCRADGTPRLHGPDVPYMVPSDAYAAYLETLLRQAIEAGVEAVYLEEPEFWAETGYGRGFERAWESRYHASYRDPASDPASFVLAAELKRALYRDLIARLCAAVKRLSAERPNGPIPCYVATHSLLNYAQARIVSPILALREIEHCDGAILQVWSHTARSQTLYQGTRAERLFEVAYLEYGSGLELVRDTNRHLWFLADPVEDSPSFGWDRYRAGYEATVVASLFHPQVSAYEVMPWPMRVFTGRYPRRPEGPPGDPIPAAYASEILVIANALATMPEAPLEWDCGTQGIGVAMADSLMFRRGGPGWDDPELSAFYGLALPPLMAGMPVQPVSLEAAAASGMPGDVRLLLLSYDGMTPPSARAHEQLAAWVKAGNGLILFGSADGPYETLPAWWNDVPGKRGPWPHLLNLLGIPGRPGGHPVGHGMVFIVQAGPIALAREPGGASAVRGCVRAVLQALPKGAPAYREQAHMVLRRGQYVCAAALSRSAESAFAGSKQRPDQLRLEGRFVDLLDGDLPIRASVLLQPGEHAFLLDVERMPPERPAVLAAAGRVEWVEAEPRRLRFRLAGPSGTTAVTRLLLPTLPTSVRAGDDQMAVVWDPATHTALLQHPNAPDGRAYTVEW